MLQIKIEENNNLQDSSQEEVELQDKTISEILYQKRQELKIDIDEAALYLKIKKSDIEAIENGDFNNVTTHLYLLGTLRAYAKFLKIDQEIIAPKITAINVKSNVENKKHQLINIGENLDLKPTNHQFINFLLISILLFLVMIFLFNFYSDKNQFINTKNIVEELEKIKF